MSPPPVRGRTLTAYLQSGGDLISAVPAAERNCLHTRVASMLSVWIWEGQGLNFALWFFSKRSWEFIYSILLEWLFYIIYLYQTSNGFTTALKPQNYQLKCVWQGKRSIGWPICKLKPCLTCIKNACVWRPSYASRHSMGEKYLKQEIWVNPVWKLCKPCLKIV